MLEHARRLFLNRVFIGERLGSARVHDLARGGARHDIEELGNVADLVVAQVDYAALVKCGEVDRAKASESYMMWPLSGRFVR